MFCHVFDKLEMFYTGVDVKFIDNIGMEDSLALFTGSAVPPWHHCGTTVVLDPEPLVLAGPTVQLAPFAPFLA